jgi:hypothetical protein
MNKIRNRMKQIKIKYLNEYNCINIFNLAIIYFMFKIKIK